MPGIDPNEAYRAIQAVDIQKAWWTLWLARRGSVKLSDGHVLVASDVDPDRFTGRLALIKPEAAKAVHMAPSSELVVREKENGLAGETEVGQTTENVSVSTWRLAVRMALDELGV